MTDQQSGKISRAEMTKALLRSGYLLESRVESKLRKQWGYVEANPTYIGNQRLLSHDDKGLRIVDALCYQQGETEIVFTWPSLLYGQSLEVEFTRFSCIRVPTP